MNSWLSIRLSRGFLEAILSIENGNKRVDFEGEVEGRKYLFKVYRVNSQLIRIDLEQFGGE